MIHYDDVCSIFLHINKKMILVKSIIVFIPSGQDGKMDLLARFYFNLNLNFVLVLFFLFLFRHLIRGGVFVPYLNLAKPLLYKIACFIPHDTQGCTILQ